MFSRLCVAVLFAILCIPASSQDLVFERGEGTALSIDNAYFLIGDRIKRSFRSDYYLTEGFIELEEGAWSILAVGFGGEDSTLYSSTELELDFSPTRCVESYGEDWNNAFTISCSLRFLSFEIKSGYELTLLMIIPLEAI